MKAVFMSNTLAHFIADNVFYKDLILFYDLKPLMSSYNHINKSITFICMFVNNQEINISLRWLQK